MPLRMALPPPQPELDEPPVPPVDVPPQPAVPDDAGLQKPAECAAISKGEARRQAADLERERRELLQARLAKEAAAEEEGEHGEDEVRFKGIYLQMQILTHPAFV